MTDKETPADKAKREAHEKLIADREAKEAAELEALRASKESAEAKANKEAAALSAKEDEKNTPSTDERNLPIIDVHSDEMQKKAAAQRGDNLSSENGKPVPVAAQQQVYYPDAKKSDDPVAAVLAEYDASEAPDEHIAFGFGGVIVRVGDLRSAFGTKKK